MDNVDIGAINKCIKEFNKLIKLIEKDSANAFALVIFVNGCFDTKSFASNKYSALVHYQKARAAAYVIEDLLQKGPATFNQAICEALDCLIQSKIVNQNLCLSH